MQRALTSLAVPFFEDEEEESPNNVAEEEEEEELEQDHFDQHQEQPVQHPHANGLMIAATIVIVIILICVTFRR